jgi:hypothetical protein
MQYTNDEAALAWDMMAMKDLGRDLTPDDASYGYVKNPALPERAWMVTFGGDLCFGPTTYERADCYLAGMRQALHRIERQANS